MKINIQQAKEMESTMKSIENAHDLFLPVATRVSRLFFVLASLMNVDPMYQYSLGFFITIFKRSLKAVEGKFEKNAKNERKAFFIRKFTSMLYKNVCRSLFEKDKLLFSFLMCLKIMDENQDLNPIEERFLMTGPTAIEFDRPNPTGKNGWLLDKSWASIMEVAKVLPAFKGFDLDFEKHINDWEKVYNSPIPQKKKTTWPGQWNDLSLFKRVIVLRLLRPDKVVAGI